MIDRRPFLGSLAGGLLAAPLAAEAQVGKVYRVGHLSGSSEAASKPFLVAFREGMRALGYVEGQNWVLDERYAGANMERLASLAQALIQRKPDVLLVSTTPGTVAAKAATSTIPIVMVLVADPVGARVDRGGTGAVALAVEQIHAGLGRRGGREGKGQEQRRQSEPGPRASVPAAALAGTTG